MKETIIMTIICVAMFISILAIANYVVDGKKIHVEITLVK